VSGLLSQPVLIVGGGIAGLTLAIALRQARQEVEIVELNPAWSVYGVGIIMQANALRALQRIGLSEACIAAGFPYSTSVHHEEDGTLRSARQKPSLDQEGLPASCGILRPNLHALLRDTALAAGVRVRLGTTVTALQDDTAQVQAQFKGGSIQTYSLVVGADGIRSHIRKLCFDVPQQPVFTGQGCWRFALPRDPQVTGAMMYHGRQSRVAGLVPVSSKQMYLLLLSEEPDNPRLAQSQLQPMLRERLTHFGGLIPAAAKHIPAAQDIIYRPLETLLVSAPWHRSRVVLMGDAAHAMTPHMAQGASMAMEDAVVLVDCLSDSADVSDALARYAERRFDRCRRVLQASVQLGEWQLRPEPGSDPMALLREMADELMKPA